MTNIANHALAINIDLHLEMNTFYNFSGSPKAYIDDDKFSVYLFDGTPVAWLSDEKLYAYSGKFLGWFLNNWIYDKNGNPAFFTENAIGGPSKPMKGMKPMKEMKSMRPMRGMKEMASMKPMRSAIWSNLSNVEFFDQ